MGLFKWLGEADNRKHIKKFTLFANKIEAIEDRYVKMSDDELKAQTGEFKRRIKENFESLDDLLCEAFAVVREASKRVLGMRHFKVQLMGGVCLHQGRIAEMRTGEGKTLVATLPTYLNALSGEGVHVVTVNDYLAKRDAEWMGKVHRFLGLSVGVAIAGMTNEAKRAAYNCDVTYATNNELGFDYLRDNMVIYKEDLVQRPLKYAIIDEVDSILIDEARTPLIISGRGRKSDETYKTANDFARRLSPGDYEIDEKKKTIHLSEDGVVKAERYFGLDDITAVDNAEINHYINNAVRAHFIMKKDKDYVVNDGEIIIVDEFTGRLMIGRRYSEGLHQAIEAKENVRIQNENKTMATITFQNYFRLYSKLAGMTGTAKTEESEFRGIYGLDVVVIPTNLPSLRVDENDLIYTTINGKYKAIIEDIAECYGRGQPVLVGTTTVERSEELADILRKQKKIIPKVLNAKYHDKEAEIVAQAGKYKAVTIATNMAGRGTDIMLGGNAEYLATKRMRNLGMAEEHIYYATSYFNTEDAEILQARKTFREFYDEFKLETDKEKEQVIAVGGLRIIGTERHESRRIDNQLRGRAGRQGDIGSSVFYLSMQDDLVRVFGGDKMKSIADFFKVADDEPFKMGLLTRQIEHAQKSIEGRHYSTRKNVLEYDNVMNAQRTTIYKERNTVLRGEPVHEQVLNMMRDEVSHIVDDNTDPKTDWNEWDCENLAREAGRVLLNGDTAFCSDDLLRNYSIDEIKDRIYEAMLLSYNEKIELGKAVGIDFEELERVILLKVVDNKWMDHIDMMDSLRRGIGLKAYGQQDPVTAYKKEGSEMFYDMTRRIQEETVMLLMRVNIERAPVKRESQDMSQLSFSRGDGQKAKAAKEPTKNANKTIGRNDPCPCGSGKKYKMCCWEKDHNA
ncbi:MAG: preprotein translocase subunit SecA [Firmicutes bacterium]|nr:preprotein translocase subunit SecA [Bacillota bacterium]